MIRPILLTAALLAASVPSAFAVAQEGHQAAPAAGALTKEEQKFLEEAAQGGIFEVQLGKLAEQNAALPEVKSFGQKMVEDHTKVDLRIAQLAVQKGVTLPHELDKKQTDKIAKLEKLSGAKFDKEYMSDMVSDHERDVAAFDKESREATDPEIKAFAAETLPTLREHLTLAKSVHDKVKKEK